MYLVLIPQVSIAQEQEYIKVAAVTVNKITLLPPLQSAQSALS